MVELLPGTPQVLDLVPTLKTRGGGVGYDQNTLYEVLGITIYIFQKRLIMLCLACYIWELRAQPEGNGGLMDEL